MIYYDYHRFKTDVPALGTLCEPYEPDTIIGIARGGVTLAHALSVYLDVRNLQSIRVESYDGQSQRTTVTVSGTCDLSRSRRVLLVDDIVDSGQTMQALLERLTTDHADVTFRSTSLFYKPDARVQPDYTLHEATEWINFFWEVDFLKEGSL